MQTEGAVISSWSQLFKGKEVTEETIAQAESLLADLRQGSPLRARLEAELAELRSQVLARSQKADEEAPPLDSSWIVTEEEKELWRSNDLAALNRDIDQIQGLPKNEGPKKNLYEIETKEDVAAYTRHVVERTRVVLVNSLLRHIEKVRETPFGKKPVPLEEDIGAAVADIEGVKETIRERINALLVRLHGSDLGSFEKNAAVTRTIQAMLKDNKFEAWDLEADVSGNFYHHKSKGCPNGLFIIAASNAKQTKLKSSVTFPPILARRPGPPA